jgi:hypothetical protein
MIMVAATWIGPRPPAATVNLIYSPVSTVEFANATIIYYPALANSSVPTTPSGRFTLDYTTGKTRL